MRSTVAPEDLCGRGALVGGGVCEGASGILLWERGLCGMRGY